MAAAERTRSWQDVFAMFILDQQDLGGCLAVLREKHNMTDDAIEKKLKFEFSWFLRRVKRKVPTPDELEERYMDVYMVFKDVICTRSGKRLFKSKHAKRAHLSCLKHIRRNCLSDIPFVSYYYPVGEDKALQMHSGNVSTRRIAPKVTAIGPWILVITALYEGTCDSFSRQVEPTH